jgi:hypothetical protein
MDSGTRPLAPCLDPGRFLAARIAFLPVSTGSRSPIGPFPTLASRPGNVAAQRPFTLMALTNKVREVLDPAG